jgi:hypothetical protein
MDFQRISGSKKLVTLFNLEIENMRALLGIKHKGKKVKKKKANKNNDAKQVKGKKG